VLTVAYLANRFPSAVEPYVIEEMEELHRRGVNVIAGSVRKPNAEQTGAGSFAEGLICLQEIRRGDLLRGVWMCLRRWRQIDDLIARVVLRGRESPVRRLKALLHTWLGACYALRLEGLGVEHIHVHHGYFGSWIGMVAARLLGVGFSVTLHGSDRLRHGVYLDVKLTDCRFCLTVSEYNRKYILGRYPMVEVEKIFVSRLGVAAGVAGNSIRSERGFSRTVSDTPETNSGLTLLTVGRLHVIKDHAFLVRACAQLRKRGLLFRCLIAGGGPERRNLQGLIRANQLENRVTLLGHVCRQELDSLYRRADVVVLTSQSEGIPLVLMEAMARGKVVLAPAITGIPELVISGKTGFLYEPASLEDFIAKISFIQALMLRSDSHQRDQTLSATSRLDWMRHAAQIQVRHNFNRKKNLDKFGDLFLQLTAKRAGSLRHEDFVLQQIQLPV
jgi:glycosyltransferase involved in cell wall biosynthesis